MFPTKDDVTASISDRHFIGRGLSAQVYKIPGYEQFALRVNFSAQLYSFHPSPVTINEAVYQGRNFGQSIMEYAPGVRLMRYQPGTPCGVPLHSRLNRQNASSNDRLYEQQTAAAADIPVSGYVDLLNNMAFLHTINRFIDVSYGNILIDPPRGALNVVDITDETFRVSNTPWGLLRALFDIEYASRYRGDPEKLWPGRQRIFTKLVTAAEEISMPVFKTSDNSANIWNMIGYRPDTPEYAHWTQRVAATARPSL